MKKLFILSFIFTILTYSFAQAEAVSFLTAEEMPTSAKFLPVPPTPTDASFYNDWQRYQWGKTMRDTERGMQAVKDADCSFEYFLKIYSEPFGMTISKENTPEIFAFLERVYETARICKDTAKANIMRIRPYVQFNEPTPVPEDEENLRPNSSYPSGHTTWGWAIALVLAEINPDNQDAILKRGYEYGDNRVIVGFHFQSDVDAARLITSLLINRLHADNGFMAQLTKAKQEFNSKMSSQINSAVAI